MHMHVMVCGSLVPLQMYMYLIYTVTNSVSYYHEPLKLQVSRTLTLIIVSTVHRMICNDI